MMAPLTLDHPAYFDRLADVEAAHWWARGMWRLAAHWLTAALNGRSGLRALDVGCGTGQTAVRLARRPEIARVVGLDPSPEALAHARRRHESPVVLGSALDVPFGDAEFDLVTCFDVLQHLPERTDRRAAAELRRVLRPGGVALVRSNARVGRRADRSGYRLDELVEVFGSSGFAVRRASYANCLPALAQELRGRWRSHSNRRGDPSGGGLQIRMPPPWINRLMSSVATIEAAVAGRFAAPLPFGHSTMVLAVVTEPEHLPLQRVRNVMSAFDLRGAGRRSARDATGPPDRVARVAGAHPSHMARPVVTEPSILH